MYSIIGISRCISNKIFSFSTLEKVDVIGETSTEKKQFIIGKYVKLLKKKLFAEYMILDDYSALHYTLLMIKKSKLIVDVNEAFGAPLIYLFKTFN